MIFTYSGGPPLGAVSMSGKPSAGSGEGEGERRTVVSAPMASPRGGRPVKTALHQAILDARIHQVRLLVEKHGAAVDSQDVYGRTPLMLACLLHAEDLAYKMMRILLKGGAQTNLKDNMSRTALHYACVKGRLQMARRLLRDDSVAVNDADNDGNTPLMLAALGGAPAIVAALTDRAVSFGMSVDTRNDMGYTALLMACKYGHYHSAYILLTKGQAQATLRDNEFFLNAAEWVQKSADVTKPYVKQRSHTAPPTVRFEREHSLYMARFTPQCCHVKAPPNPMGLSLDTAQRLPALFADKSGAGAAAAAPADEAFVNGGNARRLLLQEIEDALTRAPAITLKAPPAPKPQPPPAPAAASTAGGAAAFKHTAMAAAAAGAWASSRVSEKDRATTVGGGGGGGATTIGGATTVAGGRVSTAGTIRSEASTKALIAVNRKPKSSRATIPSMRYLFRLYSDQWDDRKLSHYNPHQGMLGPKMKPDTTTTLPDVRVQFSTPIHVKV